MSNLPPGWHRYVRQCSTCHHVIVWAVTAKGKRMPLDAALDQEGKVAVRRDAAGNLVARTLTAEYPTPEPWEHLFVPHFVTCTGGGPPRQPVPAQLPDNVTPLRRSW